MNTQWPKPKIKGKNEKRKFLIFYKYLLFIDKYLSIFDLLTKINNYENWY